MRPSSPSTISCLPSRRWFPSGFFPAALCTLLVAATACVQNPAPVGPLPAVFDGPVEIPRGRPVDLSTLPPPAPAPPPPQPSADAAGMVPVTPIHEIPFVFPRVWRGLRLGAPLGGCPAFNAENYRSPGMWPSPRLMTLDGRYTDVLACTRFDLLNADDVALGWVVPPESAHTAGLCYRSPLVQGSFAADPDNWIYAPTAILAEARRGRGPGSWMPSRNFCWYARAYLRIHHRYGLSISPADALALEQALASCGDSGHEPSCDLRSGQAAPGSAPLGR